MGCGSSKLPKAEIVEKEKAPNLKLSVSRENISQSESPGAAEIIGLSPAYKSLGKATEIVDDAKKIESLTKIQRLIRKHRSLREVAKEQDWKIFAGIDAIEEAEMFHLVRFTRALDKLFSDSGIRDQWADSRSPGKNSLSPATLSQKSLFWSDPCMSPKPSTPWTSRNIFRSDSSHLSAIDQIQVLVLPEDDNEDYEKQAKTEYQIISLDIIQSCRNSEKPNFELVTKLVQDSTQLLMLRENVTHLEVDSDVQLIVVGDLHGQIGDLIYILDENGLPSAHRKYVFNGDFVDRGAFGVEIMCVLLSLLLAHPGYVALNRGNHEDEPITKHYGFYEECNSKYGLSTYQGFVEVFRYLPLFTIINKQIFIVHGGLFIDRTVQLSDLEQIDRHNHDCVPEIPYPDCLDGLDAEGQWREFYRELQRDALWSDPQPQMGVADNTDRGSGILFGPDVCEEFMANNGFSMVIRSHQVPQRGFELPFGCTDNPAVYPAELPLLCTLFSASNYCGGDNEGAYLVITNQEHMRSFPVRATGLHFSTHHYKVTSGSISRKNKSSLLELIVRKNSALRAAFLALDDTNSGVVTRLQWAEVMQRVTTIKILWLKMVATIVPPAGLSSTAVDYGIFLDAFKVYTPRRTVDPDAEEEEEIDIDDAVSDAGTGANEAFKTVVDKDAPTNGTEERVNRKEGGEEGVGRGVGADSSREEGADSSRQEGADSSRQEGVDSRATVAALKTKRKESRQKDALLSGIYQHKKKLETIFKYFDADGDGVISRDEFRNGCTMLNQSLCLEDELQDIDSAFDLFDFDASGEISLNEFFEMFRISQDQLGAVPSVSPSQATLDPSKSTVVGKVEGSGKTAAADTSPTSLAATDSGTGAGEPVVPGSDSGTLSGRELARSRLRIVTNFDS